MVADQSLAEKVFRQSEMIEFVTIIKYYILKHSGNKGFTDYFLLTRDAPQKALDQGYSCTQ